jgi:hypothetical protein
LFLWLNSCNVPITSVHLIATPREMSRFSTSITYKEEDRAVSWTIEPGNSGLVFFFIYILDTSWSEGYDFLGGHFKWPSKFNKFTTIFRTFHNTNAEFPSSVFRRCGQKAILKGICLEVTGWFFNKENLSSFICGF